eukprot:CAMPEP_0194295690 /NCGR_PEP_ID=MMETSP0169-20130528/54069_1 /TAXON_ID=218684 /ORGANISM="Corethron pennatum, Strain L29A3" /LENGTH=175 /DNA_ID=CAMNT_0039044917 /DNA_START=9 /DNA_END=533 /DNA_ORIENTATION=-
MSSQHEHNNSFKLPNMLHQTPSTPHYHPHSLDKIKRSLYQSIAPTSTLFPTHTHSKENSDKSYFTVSTASYPNETNTQNENLKEKCLDSNDFHSTTDNLTCLDIKFITQEASCGYLELIYGDLEFKEMLNKCPQTCGSCLPPLDVFPHEYKEMKSVFSTNIQIPSSAKKFKGMKS